MGKVAMIGQFFVRQVQADKGCLFNGIAGALKSPNLGTRLVRDY
jgi:hypothetical protein